MLKKDGLNHTVTFLFGNFPLRWRTTLGRKQEVTNCSGAQLCLERNSTFSLITKRRKNRKNQGKTYRKTRKNRDNQGKTSKNMGKRAESGENIEKHGKTGRIRGKHRKTRKNGENQGKT